MSATTDIDAAATSEAVVAETAPRPRRRRTLLIVGGAATALVLGGAWLTLVSPVLAVDEVKVSGNGAIPAAEVVTASGITRGAPLLTLDTSAAAERVAAMDTVATASVTRAWPTSVDIAVVPDAAVAASDNGGQWEVWGAAGGRLASSAEQPADLPVLKNVPEASRAEALAVIGALPPEVRARVAAVSSQQGRGYLLELREGAGTVRWGDASQSELKATVLAAMMKAAPDARWFDVSSPTAPRSAVAEPARVPRGAATASPSPSPTTADDEPSATESTPTPTEAAAPQGGSPSGGTPGGAQGGGEQPLGLQPQ